MSREGVDLHVADCRHGPLALFETPSKWDRAEHVMRTVESWGTEIEGSARFRLLFSMLEENDEGHIPDWDW